MNITAAVVALALTSTVLAACGEPAGRTGTGRDPVELAAPNAASDTLLGHLSSDTADSAVHVGLAPSPDDGGDDDTVVLQQLADGGYDLALVRAGRLEAEGAESLAPLGAPLVVTNQDQALAIARDPMTADLFASLPEIGLVGLGMVPMGLRHPYGYGEPLLGAQDYQGQTINTRIDAAVQAIMTALGADLDHSVEGERRELVRQGRLRGIDASLQVAGAVDLPAVMTSNVALYERFDVVVVRRDTWDALTSGQQQELRTAVAKAADEAAASARSDDELMAAWCELPGATATTANAGELASLHAALDPLVDEIRAGHAAAVDRMLALHDQTTDHDLACGPADAASKPDWAVLEPVGDQGVLDGTWRIANDEDDLIAGGLTPSDAYNNAGVWELDITDGKALVTVPNGEICHWTFTFAAKRLLVDLGTDASCGGQMLGTYELDGDEVRFAWELGGDEVDPDAEYLARLYNVLFRGMVQVQGG